jgi:hypothetical protein
MATRTALAIASGTPEAIIRVTGYVREERYRAVAINKPWVEMFPDARSGPARHAAKTELRGDVLFPAEIVAVR